MRKRPNKRKKTSRAVSGRPRQVKRKHLRGIDALLQQALTFHIDGKLNEAEQIYRQVLTKAPESFQALQLLGILFDQQGRAAEAIVLLTKAIRQNSKSAEAHYNLGNALKRKGLCQDAMAAYKRAIALRPGYVLALNNLGNVFEDLGSIEDAITAYRRAVEADPSFAEGHYNLGNLYKAGGKFSDAVALYEQAIALKPDYSDAFNNLGGIFQLQGNIAASKAAFRRALEIRPDHAAVHSNLIFLLDFDPSQDQQSLQAERRRWAERHARPLAARIRPHGNDADPERPLRIGYVSADFYNHSAARAFGPVVQGHDPDQFEVTCYSSVKKEDDTTDRFRAGVNHWRDVRFLSDSDLAEQARADGIDILVDLSGHSEGNRLLAFAEKPAPVQITAWGHGTGTGLETMDYLLSDAVLIPPEEWGLFAEEVFDLPSSFLYEPPDDLPPVAALPAETAGHVTFGCLNRREKISAQSIELWSEILKDVPDSRLLIKARELSDETVRAALADELVAHGIGEDRLVLLGATSRLDHLATHDQVDISLDPFPQSGGISTADALWMGVAVVTLRGRTVSGRNAASILTVVGLDEFIAEDTQGYRDIAVAAARDFGRLGDIRSGLRETAARSPLGDITAYVQAVEGAYRHMWRRKCTGHAMAVAQ